MVRDDEGRPVGALTGRVVRDDEGRPVGALTGRVVRDDEGWCVTMKGVLLVLCSGLCCSVSERGVLLALARTSSGDGPDAGTAPPSRHSGR